MKIIKVPLSISGMNDLKNKIDTLKNSLDQVSVDITKELADYTYKEIQNNINNTQYKDGNDDVMAFKEINGTKAKVGMRGSQAIYDEFGTGTQGQQSPHPIKGQFNLNGYNSGKTIRRSSGRLGEGFPSKGTLYWTYKDKSGNIIYTTGIPAGKQVYNASRALRKAKNSIVKQKVGDMLSKL